MNKEISTENIFSVFPYSLSDDENKRNIALTIAKELFCLCEDTGQLSIYPRVEELPESLLDILAKDFNVEWYDFDADVNEKRRIIKECFSVHRYKGTKYAVKTALEGVYSSIDVLEWFQYGGEPYHFKVVISDSTSTAEKLLKVFRKIKYYKNLRSKLDETVFVINPKGELVQFFGFKLCGIVKHIGASVKYEDDSLFEIKNEVNSGFRFGGIHKIINVEVKC